MDEDGRPPFWVRAALFALGAILAPGMILGLALGITTPLNDEGQGILVAYGAYLALAGAAMYSRIARSFGAGMFVGAAMLAVVFLATGGIERA